MQPWMDVYNMVGGKRWKAAIEKEIRDSSHVIVLLSSRTLSKRGFVQKEIRQALEIWSETPPEEIYLIPVRIDECVPTHDQLQEIQWVDLFPSYDIGFAGIKRALETSDFIETDSSSRAQITRQLSLLGELVVNAREAIYALDEQGRYYWCNQATLDLMETQMEYIVGRHFLELTDKRDRDMRQARYSSALAGDPQNFELRRTRSDGSISHISINSVPLIANKSIIGVLEIAHDMTEQTKERNRAAREDKFRMLGQLAAGAAHDFNNSLAAILGRAQLLMRRTKDDEMIRSLNIIIMTAEDAAATVRRMQTFARQTSLPNLEPLEVTGLLRDSIEITRTRWQTADPAIDVQLHAHDQYYSLGSASELREVFVNLIVNAVDAMPKGGRLDLSCQQNDDTLRLQFADTGIGIESDALERVFEPFYTTKPLGTGLGLAVCWGILQRHQGAIRVESRLGHGTTFMVELPAIEAIPGATEGLSIN